MIDQLTNTKLDEILDRLRVIEIQKKTPPKQTRISLSKLAKELGVGYYTALDMYHDCLIPKRHPRSTQYVDLVKAGLV